MRLSILARCDRTGRRLLEVQLQRHLDLPRSPLVNWRITGGRDPGHTSESDACIRVIELRRVGQVKCFGSKFEARRFAEAEALEERKVQLVRPGTIQDITA